MSVIEEALRTAEAEAEKERLEEEGYHGLSGMLSSGRSGSGGITEVSGRTLTLLAAAILGVGVAGWLAWSAVAGDGGGATADRVASAAGSGVGGEAGVEGPGDGGDPLAAAGADTAGAPPGPSGDEAAGSPSGAAEEPTVDERAGRPDVEEASEGGVDLPRERPGELSEDPGGPDPEPAARSGDRDVRDPAPAHAESDAEPEPGGEAPSSRSRPEADADGDAPPSRPAPETERPADLPREEPADPPRDDPADRAPEGARDEALRPDAAEEAAEPAEPGPKETRSQEARRLFREAVSLSEAGDAEGAIFRYRMAIRADSGYLKAYNNLGVELTRAGRAEEAIPLLRLALSRRPGYRAARGNLGSALMALERYEEAVEAFRDVVVSGEASFEAYANMGVAYWKMGRLEQARRALTAALRVSPHQPTVHYNLARVLEELGRPFEAVDHYRAFLEGGAGSADLRARVRLHVDRLRKTAGRGSG